jgi:acyl-coenzyme A thioesterase PaaI-like protein
MRESFRTRWFRWMTNLWPCYRGTGGRVTFIASDWSEVRVKLGLSWRTRNYVGTIFGGSLYASVDPFLMLMLLKRLGPGFIVWDKAASIRFRKPGKTALTAVMRVDDAELAEVRRLMELEPKLDRVYRVELVDAEGVVHAEVDKVVQIRRKG